MMPGQEKNSLLLQLRSLLFATCTLCLVYISIVNTLNTSYDHSYQKSIQSLDFNYDRRSLKEEIKNYKPKYKEYAQEIFSNYSPGSVEYRLKSVSHSEHSQLQHEAIEKHASDRKIYTQLSIESNSYTSTDNISVHSGEIEKTHEEPSISRFRRQFNLWDKYKDISVDDHLIHNSSGYFIYECTVGGLCGGWADQIKGALVSYLLANITQRTYKAEFLKMQQCEISGYIVPNKVNWTLPRFPHTQFLNKTNHNIQRWIGSKWMKPILQKRNISKMFESKFKYHFLHANMEFIGSIKNSTFYSKELSWMRNHTLADIYAFIYKRLFKLAPRLEHRLQDILADAMPTAKHRLVCIHVRMGKAGFKHDYQVRNHIENLPRIWAFMNSFITSMYDKLFVMSDSQEVLDSAQNQIFKDNVFTIPGDIVHIDKYRKTNTSIEVACRGFERILLEYHMLMNCDVLVRGHSGLSVLASAIRGTDKDLYCLQKSGLIVPCERNNFTTFP